MNYWDLGLFDWDTSTFYITRWLSPSTLVSSTNKTDRYDIAEVLLKVALNSNPKPNPNPD
jgi:hypothetical protein